MRGQGRRAAYAALGAVLPLVLLAGCAAGDRDGSLVGGIQDVAQQRLAQGMAEAYRPGVTVSPVNGAVGVSPSERVTAIVTSGQFTQVDLRTQDGTKLPGALSPDGERWTSVKPLAADTSYVLTTQVRGVSGKQETQTSRFTTQAPGQQTSAKIKPDNGATVAAAEPVTVTFDKPVVDRIAAERALSVTSNPAVTGTAQWRGDRELVWRPADGWPRGSKVTVSLNIFGKRLSRESFGAGDVRTTFTVTGGSDATAAAVDSVPDLDPDSAGAVTDPDLVSGSPRPAANARLAPGSLPAAPGEPAAAPGEPGADRSAGTTAERAAPGRTPAAAQSPRTPETYRAPEPATDNDRSATPQEPAEDDRAERSGLPVLGR